MRVTRQVKEDRSSAQCCFIKMEGHRLVPKPLPIEALCWAGDHRATVKAYEGCPLLEPVAMRAVVWMRERALIFLKQQANHRRRAKEETSKHYPLTNSRMQVHSFMFGAPWGLDSTLDYFASTVMVLAVALGLKKQVPQNVLVFGPADSEGAMTRLYYPLTKEMLQIMRAAGFTKVIVSNTAIGGGDPGGLVAYGGSIGLEVVGRAAVLDCIDDVWPGN